MDPTTTSALDPDAMTEDEISGTTKPPKNAFTELMSPKKPAPSGPNGTTTTRDPQSALNVTHGRGALVVYTRNPESFPSPSRVLYYNDSVVAIHDVYPKSSIHLLLLPRDVTKQLMHPFDAFADATFREEVLKEVRKLRGLVASELRRRHGRLSKSDEARNRALEAGDEELPNGRDWEASVISGVHAGPSMSHLHVHVLSVDRVSEAMRHRKHYNSFATPFLVPVEDMPLAENDPRLQHGALHNYLEKELECWRCGKKFGNKFAALKRHLDEEFEEWKRD